jgi:hypothetical protein
MSTIRSLLRGSNRSPSRASGTPPALSQLLDRSGSTSESEEDSEGYYEDHCGSSSDESITSSCNAGTNDPMPDDGPADADIFHLCGRMPYRFAQIPTSRSGLLIRLDRPSLPFPLRTSASSPEPLESRRALEFLTIRRPDPEPKASMSASSKGPACGTPLRLLRPRLPEPSLRIFPPSPFFDSSLRISSRSSPL